MGCGVDYDGGTCPPCSPPCSYSLCAIITLCDTTAPSGTVEIDAVHGVTVLNQLVSPSGAYYTYCLPDPAVGSWTVTIHKDGYFSQTITATVTECGSQTIFVRLVPQVLRLCWGLSGCVNLGGTGIVADVALSDDSALFPQTATVPIQKLQTFCFDIDLSLYSNPYDVQWTIAISPQAAAHLQAASCTWVLGTDRSCPAFIQTSCSPALLLPAMGYWCACNAPYPKALDYSDDSGACTLAWSLYAPEPWASLSGFVGSIGNCWFGSYTLTSVPNVVVDRATCGLATADVTVYIAVVPSCDGTHWVATKLYPVIFCSGAYRLIAESLAVTNVCCVSGSGTGTGTDDLPAVNASGTYTVTSCRSGFCPDAAQVPSGILTSWSVTN